MSLSPALSTDPPSPSSGVVDTAVIIGVVVVAVAMVILLFHLILPAFITVLAYLKCKSTSESASSMERSANDTFQYLLITVHIARCKDRFM